MSGTKKTALLLLLSCMILFCCINQPDRSNRSTVVRNVNCVGYDWSDPDKTMILPPALLEVSGIAVIDSTTVACVQDENGIVFIFDLEKREITDHFIFYYAGDYEGIARVDSSFFVLRSDGVIFEILNPGATDVQTQIITATAPAAEYEGLCYDRRNQRLLIAQKNKPVRDSGEKTNHPIYRYDVRSGTPHREAIMNFNLPSVTRYASENKIQMADDKSENHLRISAIAIHPLTELIFAVSAANRMLFVFNEDGTVNYIEKLTGNSLLTGSLP